MKLREVKRWIEGLTEEELDGELVWITSDRTQSGTIEKGDIRQYHENLYIDPKEDNPSELFCYMEKYAEYKKEGYTDENIKEIFEDELDIAVHADDFVFEINILEE